MLGPRTYAVRSCTNRFRKKDYLAIELFTLFLLYVQISETEREKTRGKKQHHHQEQGQTQVTYVMFIHKLRSYQKKAHESGSGSRSPTRRHIIYNCTFSRKLQFTVRNIKKLDTYDADKKDKTM
jgi:hypothetical protein